ncbi:sensor domain-containing protein [Kitasatospora sp. CM 4170]|uniref:histidine kinase n=1 Tax=Kitasatospora aburaviensis TaxID=67265 RepID=A0ABW1EU13_9ACTN|nr:sensor domain-containing protein [Kitasatospora sp. CM 4170]WNM43658.1 sensor domain-containing protein [Kitasatospora sp. CM 4170]
MTDRHLPGAAGAAAPAAGRPYFSVRGGELLFAVAGLPPALVGGLYALAVLYAGTLLSLTVLGLPFVALGLTAARGLGGLHRRLTTRLLGAVVEPPRPRHRPLGALARLRTALSDTVAWRALLYLLLRLPLGVLGFAAAVLLPLGCCWLLGFPLWARLLEPGRSADRLDVVAVLLGVALAAAVPGAIRTASAAERRLARGLLGPARTEQRVTQLEHARATLSAANTDRLRRLERDLHDGTQARLVALAITLSLADDALDPPAAAAPDADRLRTLLDRARTQTDETIVELRRLTRGIHPVALDGGLAQALPGLADTAPVPVAVRLDLRERPDPAIEEAVYYCAAELITNVAKHSGARTAELTVTAEAGRLRLTVRDDGRGGAAALAAPGARAGQGGAAHAGADGGTGLAGLRERLTAVDGSLHIASPQGGPTVVTAELPVSL